MPEIVREPRDVVSVEDLLSVAGAMEREAIEGYRALSTRMSEEGRPDLSQVFERLIAEEEGHLSSVGRWQHALGFSETPLRSAAIEPLFDDEGAALVAPELLSAYRAFSMAVRNEERAFVFWSYVASLARTDEIRSAAERMAGEELGHIATLRKERRRSFHEERRSPDFGIEERIADLEHRAAALAEAEPRRAPGVESPAEAAFRRAIALEQRPLKRPALLDHMPKQALAKQLSVYELLLDCYLDAAEKEDDAGARQLAQRFAGEIVQTLTALRALAP